MFPFPAQYVAQPMQALGYGKVLFAECRLPEAERLFYKRLRAVVEAEVFVDRTYRVEQGRLGQQSIVRRMPPLTRLKTFFESFQALQKFREAFENRRAL